MTLVSQSEYARMHGVTPQALQKWKKSGWLIFVGKKVDVDRSDKNVGKYRSIINQQSIAPEIIQEISDSVDSGKTEESAVDDIITKLDIDTSYDDARRVKEIYLALLNQLKYDTESGKVIMASDVAREVGEEYAKVRTRLLSIPAEQAPRLHRLRTVTEMQDTLQEIITEALEELTKDEI